MFESVVKFAPLSGAIDVGFFTELGRRKLHVFGLDDAPIDIRGAFARAEKKEVWDFCRESGIIIIASFLTFYFARCSCR